MAEFELNTSVFTLKELREADFTPYDAVYLGDPYCRDYRENLSENPEDLKEAISLLREQGKTVYLSTYAVPRNADLEAVKQTLQLAEENRVEGVEIHNYGVLNLCRDKFPALKIHLGCLANLYTAPTVELLKEYRVNRVTGNFELSLEELTELKDQTHMEFELLLHGKMALGISEFCLLKDRLRDKSGSCLDLCRGNRFLDTPKMTLKSFGRVTLSGKDVCLLEHLPEILSREFKTFRLETFGEARDYPGTVGAIYRRALTEALKPDFLPQARLSQLQALSPKGLCNGYAFAVSGQDYLNLEDREQQKTASGR